MFSNPGFFVISFHFIERHASQARDQMITRELERLLVYIWPR
jgi:hypothetical protein